MRHGQMVGTPVAAGQRAGGAKEGGETLINQMGDDEARKRVFACRMAGRWVLESVISNMQNRR